MRGRLVALERGAVASLPAASSPACSKVCAHADWRARTKMQASVVIVTSLAVGTAVKGSYLFGAGIEACRVGIWTTEDALPETDSAARFSLYAAFPYRERK